jgi:DNA uptake protein ComE-like DNA-binding protein
MKKRCSRFPVALLLLSLSLSLSLPAFASARVVRTVNVNTATEAQLRYLPHVGPVIAHRIALLRQQRVMFHRAEELKDVRGIGDRTYKDMAPYVTTRRRHDSDAKDHADTLVAR